MAEGKSLKFQFVLDEQSFARVKRALGELTTEAAKFAKSMQGAGNGLFGGANVGRPPSAVRTQGVGGMGPGKVGTGIGQAILGDVEAFQKLAKAGTATMSMMKDAIGRSLTEQGAHVRKLDGQIELLQKRFGNLKTDAQKANSAMAMMNLQQQRAGAVQTQGQLQSAYGNMQFGPMPPTPGAPPPAQPGMFARAGNYLSNTQVAPTDIAGIARVAGMAAVGAMAAVNETMAGTRTYTTQEAQRSQLVNSEIRRVRGGDVTGMLALKGLLQDSSRRKDFGDQTGLGAQTEALIGGVGQSAKSLLGLVTGGLLGGTNGGGDQGVLTGLSTASRNTAQAKNAMEQAKEFENSTAFLDKKMALERFYGDFGTRKQVGRVLGVGLSRDRDGRPIDTYGNLNANLTEQGYSASEYAQAFVGARSMGGRGFARAHAGQIMSAQAAGYGGYGELLGAAERASRSRSAGLALGGRIDTTAGIQLGTGILGNGFDVRGTTGGAGILNAAQGPGFHFGAFGGVTDFNQVQQILAAQQLGSSITTGGMDTYQAGRNIVNAIGINPGGTTYAQDYLGTGMSLKQMMDAAGGDITKTAKALGLTPQMMKSQLSGSMGSVMDRYVDQGGSDPMSKAIRGFRGSGSSIDSYLNQLYRSGKGDEAEAIGTYFGMVTGEGEEAGVGLAGLLGGLGTKGSTKKGPGAGRGEMEGLIDKQSAIAMREDARTIESLFAQMKQSLEMAPETSKVLSTFGQELGADAEQFLMALNNLSTAMNMKAYEISKGTVGDPPRKAAPKKPQWTPPRKPF